MERVHAGLKPARAQGKRLGLPRVAANVERRIRKLLAKRRGRATAKALAVGVGTVPRVRAEALAA